MNEQRFQQVVKFGGVAVLLSVVGNLYFVMRNWEVHRDAAKWERQAQVMTVKTQIMETVLREFSARAGSDRNIAQILSKHQTPATNGGRR